MNDIVTLQWLNPLYSISGFCVGALVGMTGVGGGSLMTPLLILLFGIHPATAVGTDLLYAAVTKTGGTFVHGAYRTIDWKIVGRLAAGSLPATCLTIDVMERTDLGGLEPHLVTEEREGKRHDRAADVVVDRCERGPHDVQHLRCRHPPPVDEARVDSPALHLRRDLRPGPVDDDDIVSLHAQGDGLGRCGGGDAPTELDHDAAHVVYSALIRT